MDTNIKFERYAKYDPDNNNMIIGFIEFSSEDVMFSEPNTVKLNEIPGQIKQYQPIYYDKKMGALVNDRYIYNIASMVYMDNPTYSENDIDNDTIIDSNSDVFYSKDYVDSLNDKINDLSDKLDTIINAMSDKQQNLE